MSAVPDLAEHLSAGRRAASQVLVADPICTLTEGPLPEIYNGTGGLIIHGHMDIGPAIDAAVMETIARLTATDTQAWLAPLSLSKLRYLRPGELPL